MQNQISQPNSLQTYTIQLKTSSHNTVTVQLTFHFRGFCFIIFYCSRISYKYIMCFCQLTLTFPPLQFSSNLPQQYSIPISCAIFLNKNPQSLFSTAAMYMDIESSTGTWVTSWDPHLSNKFSLYL